MQKHENKEVVKLLTELIAIGPDRFQEMKVFFSEAFLLHTSDEVFDESNYRQQWANNIQALHTLSQAIGDINPDLITLKLTKAINLLSGKEVSHVG